MSQEEQEQQEEPKKKFRTKFFFWLKIVFGINIFSIQKKILDLQFFRPKIFFRCKFVLGPKFFSEPKYFQTQIFFRPKICSDPKWISMKMIFGGIKQSFWTWGFLNCPSQRFYLNWSLTLKTKSCLLKSFRIPELPFKSFTIA